MNSQTFSTGFNSGHLAGSATMLMLSGTSSFGHVPSGLVHQHQGMRARRDGERDLGKMQRHRFCVAEGQDQPGTLALFGADGSGPKAGVAQHVGRFRVLVLGRRGPCSAPGPAPRDGVLLTDAGLVLESDLYGRALREAGPELCHFGSKPLFE